MAVTRCTTEQAGYCCQTLKVGCWQSLAGCWLAATIFLILTNPLAACQPSGGVPANHTSRTAPYMYRVEAYAGQPYGVASIRYRMSCGDELIDQTGATFLTEKNHRVFYPVFSKPASSRFLQRVLGSGVSEPESMHVVWFLFHGTEPLEVSLQGACSADKTIEVEIVREGKFNRLLSQWWREFNRQAQEQMEWGDYPTLIETYLTSMLSRRLSLPLPGQPAKKKEVLTETLDLVFNLDSLRNEMIRNGMLGLADSGPASLPMPSGVFWQSAELDPAEFAAVQVESFADCVPEECFYLRFGTWNNQIWLRRLTDEFGGDLGRMISLRGFKPRIQSKFLNQLAIESTEFDRLFGGNLISDVALIGHDMFFQDGASVGVLLHAKNSEALNNNLLSKRQKFAERHREANCQIETIQVEGVPVNFLRTPDNRYRSFYLARGDHHLITSSIALARRFIEASGGMRPLSKSLEFRYAREQMPLDRDDTVFIFVPSKIWQKLLDPHYQIELARRNRSVTDMQIVELAALAAKSEGYDDSSQDSLVTHGFLPNGFGARPDGSQLHHDGEYWVDSVRGRRGFFVPIADVQMAGVSEKENDWYRTKREFLNEHLPQLDAMFIALKRFAHESNVERVVYDARLAPFGRDKYAWLFSMLGEPMTHHIVGTPNDLLMVQASLRGGALNPHTPPHQIFAAVHNEYQGEIEIKPGSLFKTIDVIRNLPGYIGSWPASGYLDGLPKLGAEPDVEGFTYSKLLGLWRLQWDQYSAISFDKEQLLSLKQHIKIVPAERPAQIRIGVADLAGTNMRNWANTQSFQRNWESSIANVRLLNMLVQQFGLPLNDARPATESLLDVELVCPLGGEYQLSENDSRKWWYSTHWPNFAEPTMNDDYTSAVLKWFRGFQLELIDSQSQFEVHGFLDVERTGNTMLPSFDVFKGFGNIFGGKSNAAPADPSDN